MSDEILRALIQFGIFIAIILVAIVALALCASRTSLGRAVLPRAVTDVVARLLPRSFVEAASATGSDEFQLRVSGAARLKTVQVRRRDGMTIAWTFEQGSGPPRAETFAFTRFRHKVSPGSQVDPEEVRTRILGALVDTLAAKRIEPAAEETADIWITVVAALEDEISLAALEETLVDPDRHDWVAAIRTAAEHGASGGDTIGRGSLVLDAVDSQSGKVLWRAAAIADIVVEVSDSEKDSRVGRAIAEMFRNFPPE